MNRVHHLVLHRVSDRIPRVMHGGARVGQCSNCTGPCRSGVIPLVVLSVSSAAHIRNVLQPIRTIRSIRAGSGRLERLLRLRKLRSPCAHHHVLRDRRRRRRVLGRWRRGLQRLRSLRESRQPCGRSWRLRKAAKHSLQEVRVHRRQIPLLSPQLHPPRPKPCWSGANILRIDKSRALRAESSNDALKPSARTGSPCSWSTIRNAK